MMNLVTITGYQKSENYYKLIWYMQSTENDPLFITAVAQRRKDQVIQKWSMEINVNRKLIPQKEFKTIFCNERYLDVVKVRKCRHALAPLRAGYHALEIERNRKKTLDLSVYKTVI